MLRQGTRGTGAKPSESADEISALQLGIGLGMTLVDTADAYGDGRAENIVRAAISGRRDEVFIVGKILPADLSQCGLMAAISLTRLATDRIDLYLMHWPEARDRSRRSSLLLKR